MPARLLVLLFCLCRFGPSSVPLPFSPMPPLIQVEPSLFQTAVLHIGFLSLANSTVLVEQLRALMQAVLWSSSLDSLDLTGCNLDGIEGQLLGDAASALSSLSLTAAKLSIKHISALLHVRCFVLHNRFWIPNMVPASRLFPCHLQLWITSPLPPLTFLPSQLIRWPGMKYILNCTSPLNQVPSFSG